MTISVAEPEAYKALVHVEKTRGLEYLRAAHAACERQSEAFPGPDGNRAVINKRLIDQYVRERDLQKGAQQVWIDRLIFAGIGFAGAVVGGWANAYFTGG
ncbi:hypothetical protein [Marinicauda pacifica]|uniref:hypothetical protein n=1 Tax=Marinicauda pacifica TaxID=1133559 RepID=UPI0035C818EA